MEQLINDYWFAIIPALLVLWVAVLVIQIKRDANLDGTISLYFLMCMAAGFVGAKGGGLSGFLIGLGVFIVPVVLLLVVGWTKAVLLDKSPSSTDSSNDPN